MSWRRSGLLIGRDIGALGGRPDYIGRPNQAESQRSSQELQLEGI